jgi:2-dehydro-3-deoxy-D-arabinonate dehydratase
MTGTGLVPPDGFSLEPGDVIEITIDNIGTLVNKVAIQSKT